MAEKVAEDEEVVISIVRVSRGTQVKPTVQDVCTQTAGHEHGDNMLESSSTGDEEEGKEEPKTNEEKDEEESDEEKSNDELTDEEGLGITEDERYEYRWRGTGQWEYGGDPGYKGPPYQSQACHNKGGRSYTPPGWMRHYLYVREPIRRKNDPTLSRKRRKLDMDSIFEL